MKTNIKSILDIAEHFISSARIVLEEEKKSMKKPKKKRPKKGKPKWQNFDQENNNLINAF
jgi:hypothetical protein